MTSNDSITRSEVPEQFELGARTRGWIVLADIEREEHRFDIRNWTHRNRFEESRDHQGAAS